MTSSSSRAIHRRVSDIPCMWLWFDPSLLRVCRSDIVIMYSNRGTFQALCWLLIGLQCNDCVILMTQIQLIVIFIRCEDCLFSLGLHSTEVYECVSVCVCKRWCLYVCVDASVGVGNKGRSLRTALLHLIILCFWKALSLLHWFGFPPLQLYF